MTVYTGSTLQTCALKVWGLWVSMRDFHAMVVRLKPLPQKESLIGINSTLIERMRVVGPGGLEPLTSCVSSRRSNQLSYGPSVR